MCGIAGIISDNHNIRNSLECMNLAQHTRGPDDSGFFIEGNVGISMSRLAIRDQLGGKQPMTLNDEVIVYNGEIFNTSEIISNWLDGSKDSILKSDTKILLSFYARYGVDCLSRLNGMFAFAIYDKKKRKINLVRDRFGIKPLYYYSDGKTFIFASTITAIKKIIKRSLDIDMSSVSSFLNIGYVLNPKTIYSSIKKLEPGTMLEVDVDTLKERKVRWWTLPYYSHHGYDQNELESLLNNSVKLWSISDKPVTYMLSGGLDSSTLLSYDSSQSSVYTMKFSSEQSDWDESLQAQRYATALGCNIKTVEFDFDIDTVSEMLAAYEQPFSDGFLTYPMFREISKAYSVVISGAGGDELFGNYNRSNYINSSPINKSAFTKNYFDALYKSSDPLKCDIFKSNESILDSNQSRDQLWNIFYSHYKTTNDLHLSLAYLQIQTQLTDDFLDYTDKFSMAFGVECRTPFLENDLFEYAFSIPSAIKIDKAGEKVLLKDISYKRTGVVAQRKRGFNPPISHYLRNHLKPQMQYGLTCLSEILSFNLLPAYEAFCEGDNTSLITLWRLFTLNQWLLINAD